MKKRDSLKFDNIFKDKNVIKNLEKISHKLDRLGF